MAARTKKRAAKKRGNNPGRPGSAFKRCVAAVAKKGRAFSPSGVCAAAGRKKYGAAEFARMAAAGRGRKKANSGKRKAHTRRTKSNPLAAARRVFRGFHGREPEKIVVVNEKLHYHKFLSGIGELVKLVIKTPDGHARVTLEFPDHKTLLAQNEKKNQLFIRGGDQAVRLSDFGITAPYHENEILGELEKVYYFTRKDHLRPEDGGTAVYRHGFSKLREVRIGSRIKNKRWQKPTVGYDTVNKKLSIWGGSYTIPREGIDR